MCAVGNIPLNTDGMLKQTLAFSINKVPSHERTGIITVYLACKRFIAK